MDEFVRELAEKGVLDEASVRRLDEIETRAHVPLAREIHFLLFLGALLILVGVGAAVKDRLNQLGPLTILAALGTGSAACLGYCFHAGRPFETRRVASPNVAFDYVVYLGAGLAGLFATYLEWKWHLLGDWWNLYLLLAGTACIGLAYRFDNLLAQSTGLVNLAGWAGVSLTRGGLPLLEVRAATFTLGAALLGVAEASRRADVKAHFEDTYLRFGVHLCLLSLIYGAADMSTIDFWLLLVACGALGAWSASRRKFEVFAVAAVYAYAGALRAILPLVRDGDLDLLLIFLTSGFTIAVLLRARARFREQP